MPTLFPRSPAVAGAAELAPDYLASETHYLSVAGRILAALRGPASCAAVTGNGLAKPQPLAEALRKLAGSHYTVVDIPCGAEFAVAEELCRAGAAATRPSTDGNTAMSPDAADIAPPLFVFHEADRLSERQIEEIRTVIRRGAPRGTAAVLLGRQEFLARFEQPPLWHAKEEFAWLQFDEIGGDEAIDFLRHQLAARQSQEEESRIRPILFRGLAVFGAIATVVIGASLVLHYAPTLERHAPAERATPPASNTSPASAPPTTPAEPAPSAAAEPAKPTATTPAIPPAPLQSQNMRKPDATGAGGGTTSSAAPEEPPRAVPPSSGQRLSAEQIATLMARGDQFLSAGDIASARSFYERAADAGSGGAAMRLGATFDPDFLDRAGVLGSPGDPAQAAAWYRRARDLGDAAAADRLKALNP